MKIIIINGSPRKNGATGTILKRIEEEILNDEKDISVNYFDLSDLNLKTCLGCEKCYQLGDCIIKDGIRDVLSEIETCDGVVIGSPTHGSNVSAILKNFMDRSNFIVAQSLYNKACFPLVTYEIADGGSALNILKKFFVVSGGKVRNKMLVKVGFNKNPLEIENNNKKISKEIKSFIKNISIKRKPFFQYVFNDIIIVNIIWARYFKKNKEQFKGIFKKYKDSKIHSRITKI
jgi:multimeric flavodoxin WrbA